MNVDIKHLVGLIILLLATNFLLVIWCFKLDSNVATLFKENSALKSDMKAEKIKREGEDYSLNMRFDNLVHYVDKGEYAK